MERSATILALLSLVVLGCSESTQSRFSAAYRCETVGIGTIVADDGTTLQVTPSTHVWFVRPAEDLLHLENEVGDRAVAGITTEDFIEWTLVATPQSVVTLSAEDLVLDVSIEEPGPAGSGVARYTLSETGRCGEDDR